MNKEQIKEILNNASVFTEIDEKNYVVDLQELHKIDFDIEKLSEFKDSCLAVGISIYAYLNDAIN